MKLFVYGLMIFGLTSFAVAEEEFDLELEFGIKQKSTIEDFPLQEIGQDELSGAAIAGALRATSTHDVEKKGKPAYAEQRESENKRKTGELEIDADAQDQDALVNYGVVIPETPTIPQEPFKIPDGRTYGGFSFKAYERP